MAINVRPQTDSFRLVWRHDPAIDRERFATDEEFNKAYEVAVETLDFSPLLKAGESPTTFTMRPLPASRLDELKEYAPGLDSGVLSTKAASLAFRMSLVAQPTDLAIDGMPKWRRETAAQYSSLGPLVSQEWTDFLDAIARDMGEASISASLGVYAILRSFPSSKS